MTRTTAKSVIACTLREELSGVATAIQTPGIAEAIADVIITRLDVALKFDTEIVQMSAKMRGRSTMHG